MKNKFNIIKEDKSLNLCWNQSLWTRSLKRFRTLRIIIRVCCSQQTYHHVRFACLLRGLRRVLIRVPSLKAPKLWVPLAAQSSKLEAPTASKLTTSPHAKPEKVLPKRNDKIKRLRDIKGGKKKLEGAVHLDRVGKVGVMCFDGKDLILLMSKNYYKWSIK